MAKNVQLYDDNELQAEIAKQLDAARGNKSKKIDMGMLRDAAGLSEAEAKRDPDKIAKRLIQLESLDLSFKGLGKICK